MTKTQQKIAQAVADARKPYADKIVELEATNADLLAALQLLERHLPFLEEQGCIGDGDTLAIRAAIAKAEQS